MVKCVGSKFHSPTPTVVYPYRLDIAVMRAVFGDAVEVLSGPVGETVTLCGVCVDNLNAYLVRMSATDGCMEWPERRVYGNLIRALGHKAWELHVMTNREMARG
jgi:hypothetical protein